MALIELKDIHKSYYLGKEEFPVLKGINLSFDLGESVAILGESGGGKSTLMNIIGGLDREFTGQVLVNGKALDHHDERAMDHYRRDTVGYIYQSYNLIAHLSVLDNVLVSLDMTTLTKEERVTRAKQLLTEVGLAEQIEKYPSQLSGGQKQRVAIARALAADPQVIIADEPTGALDAQNTQEVLEILNGIAKQGRLVIMVTHSQAVADSAPVVVHLTNGLFEVDEVPQPTTPPGEAPTPLPAQDLPAKFAFSSAVKHLKFNFWRNFLIVLGTAIGLFAVMLFTGLGKGISGYIDNQVTSVVNPPEIIVMPKTSGSSTNPTASATTTSATTPSITKSQRRKVAKLKHVRQVQNFYLASNASIKYGSKKATASMLPNYTKAYATSSIKYGHAPSKKGEIVLDQSAVAKKLTKSSAKKLLGKRVSVSYQTLNKDKQVVTVSFKAKVVGIATSSSSSASSSQMGLNAVNTATMTAAMKKANVSLTPSYLAVKVDKLANVKTTNKAIKKLTNAKGKRLFSTVAVTSVISRIQTYVNLASTVLAAIAGISLVVSALMIIVTMYMSVAARTKEIGILRALGESKRDIRRLFIAESLTIGTLAAILATVLAFAIGAIINVALKGLAGYAFVQISALNVVTVFAIALVISLIAALLPARHAANLNPIAALSAD